MVKTNLYEYWAFPVNDDYEVKLPEGAIPLGYQAFPRSPKTAILCLVPKDVVTEIEKDKDFMKKWGLYAHVRDEEKEE